MIVSSALLQDNIGYTNDYFNTKDLTSYPTTKGKPRLNYRRRWSFTVNPLLKP